MFDATGLAAITTGVTLLTEMVKFTHFVPDRFGLLIVFVLAGCGVFLYGIEQNYTMDFHHAWTIASAWLTVAASAGGIYGFIREQRGADVMSGDKK